jgi:hypothetical protein
MDMESWNSVHWRKSRTKIPNTIEVRVLQGRAWRNPISCIYEVIRCEEQVWRQSQRCQGLQLSRMTCIWLPHISHKHLESCAGVPGYWWIHFDGDTPLLPWLAEAACLVRWRGLLCVDGNWEYKRVRGPGFGGDINKGDINKKKQDWINVCRRILLQHRSSWPVGCTQDFSASST